MRRRGARAAALAALLAVVLGLGSVPASSGARGAAALEAAPFEDGTVLVGFHPGVPAATIDAVLRREGATRRAVIGAGTHVVQVSSGQVAARIAALTRYQVVRYAEPNYLRQALGAPNDPQRGLLWALKNTGQNVPGTPGTAGADIKAEAAWEVSTGTASVVVGVLDTGVDYAHPDLVSNVWTNAAGLWGCPPDTHGYNLVDNTCDPMDDNDHGTHVAGTIGAAGNNGIGIVGVNWTTSLMAFKVLDASGQGSDANAIRAIDLAIQARDAGIDVRVLNASWGGPAYSQALRDAIAAAGRRDILFVTGAGNGLQCSHDPAAAACNDDTSPFYPASYLESSKLAVAATDPNDDLALFSRFGILSVDLAAPGANVLSTVRGGGYAYKTGTSAAAAHVTGAAALILAARPRLSVARLSAAILDNVDLTPSLSGKTATSGRLNVYRAVTGAPPPPSGTAPRAPDGLTTLPAAAPTAVTGEPPSPGATSAAAAPGPSAAAEAPPTSAAPSSVPPAQEPLPTSTPAAATAPPAPQRTAGAPPPPAPTAAPTQTAAPEPTATAAPANTAVPPAPPAATKTAPPASTPPASTPPARQTPAPAPTAARPAAPANLTAKGSAGRIELAWTDVSGNERGFVVERATDDSGFAPYATVGANVTAYTDAALGDHKTLRYRVRAVNAAGSSPPSNVASVTFRG